MEKDGCDEMELEVVQKDENSLKFFLKGEEHTLANLLRRVLKQDEHVTYAAYKVSHPLIDQRKPVFVIKTDGKETPKEALIKAAQKIKEQVNEFGEKF
jgi:DNA-directed RNA polymerase subunit L